MTRTLDLSRRSFLGHTVAASVVGSLLGTLRVGAESAAPAPAAPLRKVKVGVIGGGHRGNLIGGFMRAHGGYEMHACADYFPSVAESLGNNLGVDKARRFSGLSGYQKVIESGVEALAILDVPYFYPEQAAAATAAGCHVYMAKPVAVDVPGTLSIGATAEAATKKGRCFLVDYQMPTDPANAEVAKRVQEGGLGGLAHLLSFGMPGAWSDPPKGPTLESRLQKGVWLSDIALSGDSIVSYDIHIIDGLMAVLGQRAVSAVGSSRICRPNPHGDRTDACGVVFELADGTIWTHVTQSLNNNMDYTTMTASLFGLTATAHIGYSGKAYVRGGDKHYVGTVSGQIYNEGAQRNVADFHRHITEGHFENLTAMRAVDGHLTAILGREAAARKTRLTMEELIKEGRKLTADLTGLRA